MKNIILLLAFSLLFFTGISAQTPTENNDFVFKSYALADSGKHLGKIIPYDLDRDGYKDLIFVESTIGSITKRERNVKIVPGTADGINLDSIQTIGSKNSIEGRNFLLGDWDGDGYEDLIFRKSRSLNDGNSATTDLIEVWYLNKTTIIDTVDFTVPTEVYNGNPTNPKEMHLLKDMDLDGLKDLIFIGYNTITIGWNNGGGMPEFDEITSNGANTYSMEIFDVNQDGYPDFINDDQSAKAPVIHINQRDRSFTKKSTGLPKWNYSESSPVLYENFEAFWYDENQYPDLFIRFAGPDFTGGVYKLYTFSEESEQYEHLDVPLDHDLNSSLIPIHLNNDGYIDFAEIGSNIFRFWFNTDNTSYASTSVSKETQYGLINLFHLDIDGDSDQDLFYSFDDEDTLYQIVNTETITNEIPSRTSVDSVEVHAGSLNLFWEKSIDQESLSGHLTYAVSLVSADDKKIDFDLHSNQVELSSLPAGNYSLTIVATDPLDGSSEQSESFNFTVETAVDIEKEQHIPGKFILNQNYPNPFNPSTVISYQLPANSYVRLAVFDLLGRKVATLVDGPNKAGHHEVRFNAPDLSSGIYFYRLDAGGFSETKRFMLIK